MSMLADAVARPLWIDRLDPAIEPRAALDRDLDVDVAIVGGGYSGLWTAYYLVRRDPSLRIAVVERDYCGFGASGRNGGWAVGELAAGFATYAARSSPDAALRLTRLVFDAVDEIGRVTAAEAIECDYAKGGNIRVARNAPQARRQCEEIDELHAEGLSDGDIRLLDAAEAQEYLAATEVRSGIFFAHCAAIDPAKLVRGLADVVAAAGVRVFECTAVTAIAGRTVTTPGGTIRAEHVIRATEAYTRDLPGHRRDLLPIYSHMIATEPLPADVIDRIGLDDRPTFNDDRHIVVYGQRTADDRIAFGAQGVPYLYGSSIDPANETDLTTHERVRDILVDMIPVLADAAITHRWGGVLAIPRDWSPGLTFDRASGSGVLGGYVGEGVAAANLAGRTMADLVLGEQTERTDLPWIGHTARRWEPEPLRWLGVRGSRAILGAADRSEFRTDREARLAFRLSRLLRGGNR